ncbi:putative SnoaL-like aldol condensation-catalyzing enzyme [Deinococcus metalli]|uniref:Putative SnoaL-like aldol condensation-catalyzing enzyme n=1 Tax=Deinococcus metalli TaxID=1141878 RepID=A0A7W8KFG4_9DEIO|nr:nuclear transport factor 2 family protein [Deinococcus metalli]MBB5376768.1 putative SnoaL-like aldol condensation-catalyzing enzyme [Deinococcus metalli]GHF45210.1 hypothetical protein GCM10017781_21970 [Deinococcus metalli]
MDTAATRVTITAFAALFYGQKDVRAAFSRYVAPDYVQHNPGIPDGRDAAIAALGPMFARPETSFEVRRILADGDHAVIHLHARSAPDERGGAVCDLYRLEGGLIVEHWDVMQPVPERAANANTMF